MDGPDAPVYVLRCRTADGARVDLRYSPRESLLTDEHGAPMLSDIEAFAYEDAERIAPHAPGWKSAEVDTLKIQLGLRCNYSCSYCNQSSSVPDATATRTADADGFLAGLETWLQGSPARIEFWGGEPLLYFAKLRRLVPALRGRFPAAFMSIVTNGSLLDEEILDFVERWDLHVTVSHDGPGQHLRGPDPFEDPLQAHWIRELWRRRGGARGRMSVNVVLTRANADIEATAAWLSERFGDPALALDTEGAVSIYDDQALHGSGRWTMEEYATLQESLARGFETGTALRYRTVRHKARDFLESLQRRRPARAVGQKCGMDQPDQLAVDLQGNVMTCQNTGAQGRHHIGSVKALGDVRLDTATHWSHREACSHCPVVQLCKGGCMFLDGEHFAQSCENEYRYNLGILDGILRQAAGLKLEEIVGDVRRPKVRRTIPVHAVPA